MTPATRQSLNVVVVGEALRVLEAGDEDLGGGTLRSEGGDANLLRVRTQPSTIQQHTVCHYNLLTATLS